MLANRSKDQKRKVKSTKSSGLGRSYIPASAWNSRACEDMLVYINRYKRTKIAVV
jgi:hypothetical protein